MSEKPSKEWFHKQGIPAGVGMPEDPYSPENMTPEEIKEELQTDAEEDAMSENLMFNDDKGYVQQMAPGEKARILQYIHTNLPLQKNPSGRMTGEIPPEMFYAFYGWLAHNSSLGNLTEQEVAEKRVELDIQELEVMMAMNRKNYTPEVNASIRNAKNLCDIKLTQNKDGNALYLAHAEVSEDLRAYRVLKGRQTSRTEALKNHLRGRG